MDRRTRLPTRPQPGPSRVLDADPDRSVSAFSRRSFLQSTVAALGLSGGLYAPLRLLAAGKIKRVLVGAHPWVYAAPLPGYDITPILDQVFSDVSYAGMDGLELMENVLRHSDSVERIGALSAQYNLPVIGTSYGAHMWDRSEHQRILEDAEMVITRLAELGGKTFGTSVGRAPTPKTPEQLDAQAELLSKIINLADKAGVELNLHNHTYEVENHQHDLKGTLARIPKLKLGPDLNWLIRGGVEPVEFIREHGRQITFLHLRDQNADGTWSEALGEGATDFKAIARELQRIKFSGYAVVELAHERDFQPTRPLRESLKMSRRFVRETLGY
jgi:sugar phosphate isomerase/epimerase